MCIIHACIQNLKLVSTMRLEGNRDSNLAYFRIIHIYIRLFQLYIVSMKIYIKDHYKKYKKYPTIYKYRKFK